MSFISYAQNFEDVMLWRALKYVENGFYIDVGANDPSIDSVTKAFYERGWHGINIEPLPSHHADLLAERPRDINLQCAAGAFSGEIEIWDCDIRGWATASVNVAAQHIANGQTGIYHKVPVYRLSEICDLYVTGEIHFLKIDVEGFERSVIEGADFFRFRPWILVIEATLPNSIEEIHYEWEIDVLSADYLLAYADGLNRFYVANEHTELLSSLRYPPNVFDKFMRFEQLTSEIKAQQADADARQAESKAQQAEANARQAEATARQAEAAAQQAESKFKLAEARCKHAEAKLNAIYLSRSWRATHWVRWLSYQASALSEQGVTARFKSIGKRLRNVCLLAHLRRSSINAQLARSSASIHLALDMYVLGQGVKTGVYRVCDELFQRLANRSEFDARYLIRSSTRAGSLKYLDEHDMRGPQLPEDVQNPSNAVDILLSPFGVAPQSWRNDRDVRHAHIIYDLIAVRRPEYFTAEASSEVHQIIESLTTETLIFAISEYTKQDLLNYRKDLSPEQITVIPLAAGEQFSPCADSVKIDAVRTRYSIPMGAPYILSLATLEIRKNLNRVVESYVLYMNENPSSELYLVLAGMSGWKLDSLNQSILSSGRWRHRIILTGFVEDRDLSALYSGALCFIYLSQFEGFGLPPLEAMACGTPVICSNNSSLPEVVGSAGVLIDADDVASAVASLTAIVTQPGLRLRLSEQGLERAKLFTWEKCELVVLEALRDFSLRKPSTSFQDGLVLE
ncbi:FkbM family methyltransferase [Stutzerimonas zhaodongensis]|uniref:FkbM family methyltransferase n=1 Tax=Stutzerimonas zhaodongensis TaxID=1176257 RepID=A0A3M2HVG8_9GAMM|nr:FkbM family methyltransferase [Stutzerimonas zhaodongensis]MCQ4314774.1 FkbM family methyltransferase [Stutzerimonas zhaodongensis]RMH92275.1 FkbM family methyltransferase [Stutzerimonas zhaodongensis]